MSEPNNVARDIFLTAIEHHSPEQWPTFLDGACQGDDELRQRVEDLLRSHQHLGTFHEDATTVSFPDPDAERPGSKIGPYKLLEQIGEGGMGLVYMAVQSKPIRRQVALKIIKAGMDSRQVIARFEAERQALAMMDHHHIARVFDAGTTDKGRPYFVMELVKGVPINEYCDGNRLTPQERLELFVPVCHAIQHAHQKGIIHRDIKPSNVLVTLYDGHPVPKVIDFGIAKATQQPLTKRTMFTQLGQIMGTMEYMSPEQAEMNQLDVDTRSDVYSLGVLLYELLTGSTPITKDQLRQAGVHEMVRTIREVEPPKPSTRLSQSGKAVPSISAVRRMAPAKLSRFLSGDLDWIVMKSLEKDRTRRYETASALAADIERFLREEAIEACPPSAMYTLRKFARRNRVLLITLSAIAITLLGGTVVSTWMAIRALRSEDLANNRLVSEQTAHAEARDSEENATRRLFDSYLAQARASRWSGRPGQRLKAIEAIRAAAKLIEPLQLGEESKYALRNEAIAAITSIDLREGSSWKIRYDTEGGVAVSPDLKSFATDDRLSESPSVFVARFDAPAEPLLRVALSQPRGSLSVFSANGQYLVVAHEFGQAASVWDIAQRQKLLDVDQTAKAISADARLFAAGQADASVRIYDLPQGELRYEHAVGDTAIALLCFSPDGRQIAVAHSDHNIIEFRDVATGKVDFQVGASNRKLGSLAWHPDGRQFAAGCWQRINVWDLSKDLINPLALLGHESQVVNVQFHPTRQMLLSNSWDGTTRFWNSVTGDQILQVRGSRATFDESGNWLSLCRGLELGRWEIFAPEACRWLCQGNISSLSVHPGGRLLGLATGEGVQLWDLTRYQLLATLPVGYARGLMFHPRSHDLLTSAAAGVQVWPIRLGAHSLNVGPPAAHQPVLPESGYISASADGNTLIVDHRSPSMRMGYATLVSKTGNSTKNHELKRPHLEHVAASPDGRWVATGNKWGRNVDVWNAITGDHVRQLECHGSAMPAFSPDNRWIVGNSGEAVRFWEVGSWQLRHEFAAAASAGSAVAFTADSRLAAIARGGEGLLLVNVGTGEPIAVLETNARRPRIESLCFTPDAQKLVAAAGTRGVYLWDLTAIRKRLRELDLDWDPPASTAPASSAPTPSQLQVEVDLGTFTAKQNDGSP